MERPFFVWREGKGGLSLILSSPEVGRGAFSIQSHYSHQLVGMGLLKYLSKEGFGSEPPEFCHSQLLSGMTMLAAGCTFLWEHRRLNFFTPPLIQEVLGAER